MKKLKRDIDIYSDQTETPKQINNGNGSVNRGTRNLMKDIQAELGNEENVDDTDFDSENQTDY
jgi:hypothetical protein